MVNGEIDLLASGSMAALECPGSLIEISLPLAKPIMLPDTFIKSEETPEKKICLYKRALFGRVQWKFQRLPRVGPPNPSFKTNIPSTCFVKQTVLAENILMVDCSSLP